MDVAPDTTCAAVITSSGATRKPDPDPRPSQVVTAIRVTAGETAAKASDQSGSALRDGEPVAAARVADGVGDGVALDGAGLGLELEGVEPPPIVSEHPVSVDARTTAPRATPPVVRSVRVTGPPRAGAS